MNTPYDPKLHLALLKKAAPGLRKQPADSFGASSSNKFWAAIEVPYGQGAAFAEACRTLNIYAGVDCAFSGYSCYKLCRYARDEPPALRGDAQIRAVHGTSGGL